MADMLESASAFVEEYAALEHQLADPATTGTTPTPSRCAS